jgi:hypothetical protein
MGVKGLDKEIRMTIDCYKTHVLTTRTDTFTPPFISLGPISELDRVVQPLSSNCRNVYEGRAHCHKHKLRHYNFRNAMSKRFKHKSQEPIRLTNNVSSRIQANAPSTSPRRYMLEECRSPMARGPQGQGGNDSHLECRNNNFLRNVSASIS